MKFAITVSSYDLAEFVELNILALRKVFGESTPILVSDDLGMRSADIRAVAERLGTHHLCSDSHRGHFAGDLNSTVASLAFAESEGADVAVKVSQRLLLCEPSAREIIERYFSDPNVWMAVPGRIHPGTIKRAESRFFSNLSTITDLLCVRTWKLRPNTVKELYEERIRSKRSRFDSLIEALFAFIGDVTLAGHTVRMPEFSHHAPGRDKLFLRRCQSEPAEYQILASKLGMPSFLPLLQEWRALSSSYRPCPVFS